MTERKDIQAFFEQVRDARPANRWGRELGYDLLSDDDKAQFDALAAWLEQEPACFDMLAYHFYDWLEVGHA